MKNRLNIVVFLLTAGFLALPTVADWPGYGGDMARSRVADSSLDRNLVETWHWSSPVPPRPAWPGPAKWDAYNKVHDMKSRLMFDAANHVAIGPERVYVGSSGDDKVYAIDRQSGLVQWTFYTEGPIRFSPWLEGDRLLVGSDDGRIYCLDARTGEEVWSRRPAGADRRVPGNGRIISAWPIRTGPIVRDGIVYCTAGLFPLEGVYLSAYDLDEGNVLWSRRFEDLPAQGYLLASQDRLYVPTSRDAPVIFDRSDGTRLGRAGGQGGTWALLTGDTLVYGPGKTGTIGVHEASKGDQLATFPGNHMIVTPSMSYLHTDTELVALDRSEYLRLAASRAVAASRQQEISELLAAGTDERATLEAEAMELGARIDSLAAAMKDCFKWRAPCSHPYAIVLAGDLVIAGGDDEVAAYDAVDGSLAWSAPLSGAAHGLAVDDGVLYVTTDSGELYCFESTSVPGETP
ncbi:MAG: PQQ-binding-like beta-propeller repeat protein [Planctomycetota bacterium]|nr:PQQ-binding-like beta-propeller repeat protein [Planctomycetota bacterium]